MMTRQGLREFASGLFKTSASPISFALATLAVIVTSGSFAWFLPRSAFGACPSYAPHACSKVGGNDCTYDVCRSSGSGYTCTDDADIEHPEVWNQTINGPATWNRCSTINTTSTKTCSESTQNCGQTDHYFQIGNDEDPDKHCIDDQNCDGTWHWEACQSDSTSDACP